MFTPAKKRMCYDATFKLKIVELALETSNMKAARHYCVNKKQVCEWKKAECVLKEMPKKSKCNQNRQPKWPKLEDVATQVNENRQSELTVTHAQIHIFTLKWANQNKENSRDFKVYNSWCTCFMKQQNLVLREKMKMV